MATLNTLTAQSNGSRQLQGNVVLAGLGGAVVTTPQQANNASVIIDLPPTTFSSLTVGTTNFENNVSLNGDTTTVSVEPTETGFDITLLPPSLSTAGVSISFIPTKFQTTGATPLKLGTFDLTNVLPTTGNSLMAFDFSAMWFSPPPGTPTWPDVVLKVGLGNDTILASAPFVAWAPPRPANINGSCFPSYSLKEYDSSQPAGSAPNFFNQTFTEQFVVPNTITTLDLYVSSSVALSLCFLPIQASLSLINGAFVAPA